MRPFVFIPLPYKKINIEQAERLAYEIESFLVKGYGCGIEHDAMGEPNPINLMIYLKEEK